MKEEIKDLNIECNQIIKQEIIKIILKINKKRNLKKIYRQAKRLESE